MSILGEEADHDCDQLSASIHEDQIDLGLVPTELLEEKVASRVCEIPEHLAREYVSDPMNL